MMVPKVRRLAGSAVLLMVWAGCGGKKDAPAETGNTAGEKAPETDKGSGNRPPEVTSVVIQPDKPTVTEELSAVVESKDEDGDYVNHLYQWMLNGEKMLGEINSTLSAGKARHGDTLVVEVLGNDGKEEGKSSRSKGVTIKNSLPRLGSEPSAGISLDGYRMEVTDDDGDPITYRLQGAPANMSLDANGTLSWKPGPNDKSGDYNVTLIAEDGQGGNVTVQFPVHVTGTQAPSVAGSVSIPAQGK